MAPSPPPFHHRPVLVAEVVGALVPTPPGLWVDATVGGGGHAAALLAADPTRRLLGLDRDADALEAARRHLAPFGDRVVLRHTRFDHLAEAVGELGHTEVAAVLFDLGVSSPQLDRPERGFSYRHEAPLDMRMDQDQPRTAADVVNGADEAELARILARYGDERYARRIAAAIVAARPVRTTAELARIVTEAIPAPARRHGGHPAKRTFQALRIEVNDELDVLVDALDQAVDLLLPGGRCAVLAYHSGEDRIVKQRFRRAAVAPAPPAGLAVEPPRPSARLLRSGAERPSPEEVAANPRAASARLRVLERLGARAS